MPVPERHQHVDEAPGGVGQEDAGERVQQVLLPLDFEEVQGEGIDVDDPDTPDRLLDMLRMRQEMCPPSARSRSRNAATAEKSSSQSETGAESKISRYLSWPAMTSAPGESAAMSFQLIRSCRR
jgi:hypothetical protein